MTFDPRMNRKRLLQAGAGLSLAGLLAACGDDEDDGGDAETAAAPPEQASSVAAETGATSAAEEATSGADGGATSAEEGATSEASEGPVVGTTRLTSKPEDEDGALEVFDWQGYEDTAGCPDSCYGFWDKYVNGPYGESNPLKFTFLEDDQQALAKCAAGFKTDVIHPCIAYTRTWQEAGLIQPWDTTAIDGFDTIEPALYEGGVIDGEVYAIPWDWGYSSLVYRNDKVEPEEQSWNLLLDERYKGRIGFFSDGVAIIKVGGLINGVTDPNKMTSEEIDAAKETMIRAKPNIRMFWTNQTDAINEMIAGNIDISYAWPDAYFTIRDGLENVEMTYMQPKEGRLAWVCAYILHKDSPRPALAHELMKCIPDAKNAVSLIDNYAYGAAGASTPEVIDQVTNTEAVETFGLRDLKKSLAPPLCWPEVYLPNRADYVKAAEEVKAA